MLNRRSDIFSLPIILFFLCVASQAIADKFPIANSASPETSYDIAFDGTNFLVAIEAETIGAQLVSPSGELVGSFISTGRSGRSSGRRLDGTGPGFPHVAFDGTNYLLVWTEGTSESVREHVLVGQFVSPSGSTVGEPFEINSAALEASVRGIAYGDGQYMVAYSQRPFGDAQTSSYYSRTVSSDGDVGPEFSYTCPDPDDECRRGDDSIRAIAFAQSTFLLVWVDRTPPNFPVLGKSLSSSGRLGAEFTINASPAPSNENSTVGTDGTNFLVVWADNVGEPGAPDWELFGQLISPFGDPIGDVISVVENPGNQLEPYVTFDGVNYLVTWTDTTGLDTTNNDGACLCWDIRGQYISTSGQRVGSEIVITDDPGNQVFSPTASGDGKTLVAWGDLEAEFENSTSDNVYGDLLTAAEPVDTDGDGIADHADRDDDNDGVPDAGLDSSHAYLVDHPGDELHVVDLQTNQVVDTIALDPAPTAVVASPDGQRVYIRHDPGTVSVIDTTDNSVVASIEVGAASAGDVAIAPINQRWTPIRSIGGSRLYVTNNVDSTLSVIDTELNAVIQTIAAGQLGSAHSVAVSPAGTELYVTDFDQPGSTFVVDANPVNVNETPIVTGAGSNKVAFSPDASRAWVSNSNSNSVVVIDTGTRMIEATVAVGTNPSGLSVTPDGSTVYVANVDSQTVSAINTADLSVTTIEINASTGPSSIAITADGAFAYVGGVPDSVPIIDTTTNTITDTISVTWEGQLTMLNVQVTDNCPLVANADQVDTDGDGDGDACEEGADSDGDGVPNTQDAFPNDATETVDSDMDGVGDNADTDDDNDGMTDVFEDANGLDRLDAADADGDADGDRISNLVEFQQGTDINDAADAGDACLLGDSRDETTSDLPIESRLYIANPGSNRNQQTFLRIVNNNDTATNVEVYGVDDAGVHSRQGALSFTLAANEAKQMTAQDIEDGNTDKGLDRNLCDGQGKWQLRVRSDNPIVVMGLIRTPDGFLTSLNDVVPTEGSDNVVYFANPGSNINQQTFLRILNRSEDTGTVTMTGVDDAGVTSGGEITFTLGPNESKQMTAQDIENGNTGKGLIGNFDDGTGKWRITVTSTLDLKVMSLIRSSDGFLTNLSGMVDDSGTDHVIYFANQAGHATQQTFLRIINVSDDTDMVTISGIDDDGNIAPGGDVMFELTGGQSKQMTGEDLEGGNTGKGLMGMLGDGEGRWHLTVSSTLDLRVMSLVLTSDGFLTNLSRTTPRDGGVNDVWIFNPASNTNQRSSLRLVNDSDSQGSVTITGIDDGGNAGDSAVTFNIMANSAMTITSVDLESGNADLGLVGALGDGQGKWRLAIESDVDLQVQSLLETPSGFLTNLSRPAED